MEAAAALPPPLRCYSIVALVQAANQGSKCNDSQSEVGHHSLPASTAVSGVRALVQSMQCDSAIAAEYVQGLLHLHKNQALCPEACMVLGLVCCTCDLTVSSSDLDSVAAAVVGGAAMMQQCCAAHSAAAAPAALSSRPHQLLDDMTVTGNLPLSSTTRSSSRQQRAVKGGRAAKPVTSSTCSTSSKSAQQQAQMQQVYHQPLQQQLSAALLAELAGWSLQQLTECWPTGVC